MKLFQNLYIQYKSNNHHLLCLLAYTYPALFQNLFTAYLLNVTSHTERGNKLFFEYLSDTLQNANIYQPHPPSYKYY